MIDIEKGGALDPDFFITDDEPSAELRDTPAEKKETALPPFDPTEVGNVFRKISERTNGDYLSNPDTTPPEEVNDEMLALLALYATTRKKKKGVEKTLDQLSEILTVGAATAAENHGTTRHNFHNRKAQAAIAIAGVLEGVANGTVSQDTEVKTPQVQPSQQAKTAKPAHRDALPLPANRHVSADHFGMYLQEAGQFPVLTKEQEIELSKRIEAGLYAQKLLELKDAKIRKRERDELQWLVEDGVEAKNLLLNSNLRLVISWVKKNRPTYGDTSKMEDRVEMGNLGLIRAVEKFDYKKGYKFSTYATQWIRQFVDREMHDTERLIRLPVHQERRLSSVEVATKAWQQKYGRAPSDKELSKKLKFDVAKFREETRIALTKTVSLNTPLGGEDGDRELGEIVVDNDGTAGEKAVEYRLLMNQLSAILGELLSQEEADIFKDLYGIRIGKSPMTEANVERLYGIGTKRLRYIQNKGIRILRANPEFIEFARSFYQATD